MAKTKTIKKRSIFDFLSDLTTKKTPWEKLSVMDQKVFAPYIINRFLSMDPDLIEIVNYFQQYTIGTLKPKEVYKLYLDFLPKSKLGYNKYIKGTNDDKYQTELVDLFALHFLCSTRVATEYLDLMFTQNNGKELVTEIIRKYGHDEKTIKKYLKT